MAKKGAVWGIDLGQCALKALRCVPDPESDDQIVITDFEYLEHPKLLSQPEADPVELVREALSTFLSRHAVGEDTVAISIAGQSGLSRFIKLPPVEEKQVAKLMRFEARQQIPFSLDDVVWDYQQMSAPAADEDEMLETEVGLFAMKRDQVLRAMHPFEEARLEVDIVQLSPVAVYNAINFDRFYSLQSGDDASEEPASLVVLSLGTDNADLVITNGSRMWQRNIPVGGNHFTKAISKELKMTFAKAEELKRNVSSAPDPKQVFQAMKPVFNQLHAEIQRSIGYYRGIDKDAQIKQLLGLGNAVQLPGLQRFLSENLDLEVVKLDEYRGLRVGQVEEGSDFQRNLLAFANCYGLCVQGLERASFATNLLPEEIRTARIIRDKKPWALAGAAALLLACTINFLGAWNAWRQAHTGSEDYQDAFRAVKDVYDRSNGFKSEMEATLSSYEDIYQTGVNLLSNVEGRIRWIELYKAVAEAMPRYENLEERPEEIGQRQELHIDRFDCQKFDDLGEWYGTIEAMIESNMEDEESLGLPGELEEPPIDDIPLAEGDPDADPDAIPGEEELDLAAEEPPAEEAEQEPPSGPGWVIELKGYHYYNPDDNGAEFVHQTLIKQLLRGTVQLPNEQGELEPVPMQDLGISHPVIVKEERIIDVQLEKPSLKRNQRTNFAAPTREEEEFGTRRSGAEDEVEMISVPKFGFIVQFAWQPTTPSSRRLAREQAASDNETDSMEPGL